MVWWWLWSREEEGGGGETQRRDVKWCPVWGIRCEPHVKDLRCEPLIKGEFSTPGNFTNLHISLPEKRSGSLTLSGTIECFTRWAPTGHFYPTRKGGLQVSPSSRRNCRPISSRIEPFVTDAKQHNNLNSLSKAAMFSKVVRWSNTVFYIYNRREALEIQRLIIEITSSINPLIVIWFPLELLYLTRQIKKNLEKKKLLFKIDNWLSLANIFWND